jgi:hypothetical protein
MGLDLTKERKPGSYRPNNYSRKPQNEAIHAFKEAHRKVVQIIKVIVLLVHRILFIAISSTTYLWLNGY